MIYCATDTSSNSNRFVVFQILSLRWILRRNSEVRTIPEEVVLQIRSEGPEMGRRLNPVPLPTGALLAATYWRRGRSVVSAYDDDVSRDCKWSRKRSNIEYRLSSLTISR